MHGRSRKIALAPVPSRDELTDAFPSDDAVVIEIASFVEETRANERICLWCGGDGSRHEGCDHAEVARLHEPSRAASEMVARLKHAAAEHRAASRALRALVTSELGRGRAELETKSAIEAPEPVPEPPAVEAPPVPEAVALPCPRCAERDAEPAKEVANPPRAARKRGRPVVIESASESESESAIEAAPVIAPVAVAAPRVSRKRGHVPIDQQSFPFLQSSAPARLEGKTEEAAPDSEPLPF